MVRAVDRFRTLDYSGECSLACAGPYIQAGLDDGADSDLILVELDFDVSECCRRGLRIVLGHFLDLELHIDLSPESGLAGPLDHYCC